MTAKLRLAMAAMGSWKQRFAIWQMKGGITRQTLFSIFHRGTCAPMEQSCCREPKPSSTRNHKADQLWNSILRRCVGSRGCAELRFPEEAYSPGNRWQR